MTTRTRNRSINSAAVQSTVYGRTGHDFVVKGTSSKSRILLESITDEVTPGYFKMSREGKVLPVNPFTRTKETLEFTLDGKLRANHTGNPGAYTYGLDGNMCFSGFGGCGGNFPSIPALPSFQGVTQGNIASIEAVANARRQAWDVLTFAAEFRESVKMFRKLTGTLIKRIFAVITRGPGGKAKTFADQWMEYRYGYMPVVYDIEDMQAAIKSLNDLVHRLRGFGYTEAILSSSSTTGWGNGVICDTGGYGGGWLHEINKLTQVSRSYHASALIELHTAAAVSFDPVVTAYEIMPYSWMLDWVFNVGSALTAFSPFAQGDLVASSVTERLTSSITMVSTKPSDTWYVKVKEFSSDSLVFSKESKMRHKYEPTFELGIDFSMNTKKSFDLLALSMGRITKVMRQVSKLERSSYGKHFKDRLIGMYA